MSQKRMMSKQQRLYHEYNNTEKVKEELIELSKDIREYEERTGKPPFNTHRTSFYN